MNITKQKSHSVEAGRPKSRTQLFVCFDLNKMKFTAIAICVFLAVLFGFGCTLTSAKGGNEGGGGGGRAGGHPKNNWKNEICTELGHLLLEAEKINELKHCSTTIASIRNGINERVTSIRRILNNHGALCDSGTATNVRRRVHDAGAQLERGKFNKNSFD